MARSNPDPFALTGTVLDGKFRVEKAVAEGGFGVVYRAVHVILDRPIALKVLKTPPELPPDDAIEFNASFVREAKAIVRINHPNIVQVLDFGVSSMPTNMHAPWMALEWLDGRTLRDDLRGRRHSGGRTIAECFTLIRPALEALAYAHQEGIAHRDIKPANLMLAVTRRGVELKLLDFGIAKVMEEGEDTGTGDTHTRSARSAFSLNYAAPEQIGGTRTGPWTDVHAVALLITELLTDEPAIDGADRTEMCAQILATERPSPSRRGVDAGAWEPVLRKALALRVADRYRDAGELLAALESAQNVSSVGHASAARPVVAMVEIAAPNEARASRVMMRQVAVGPTPEAASVPAAETTMRGSATSIATGPLQSAASPPRARTGAIVASAIALVAALGVGGIWRMREHHRAPVANPTAMRANPERAPSATAAPPGIAAVIAAPSVVTDAATAAPAPQRTQPVESAQARPTSESPVARRTHRSHDAHAHGSTTGGSRAATGNETFDVN